MPREDYFKKRLDEIGQLIGKVLAGLMGTTRQEEAPDAAKILRKLKEGADLDVEALLKMDDLSLVSVLRSKIGREDQLEMMAGIFYHLGVLAANEEESSGYYNSARALLEDLEAHSRNYSLHRSGLLSEVRRRLGQ